MQGMIAGLSAAAISWDAPISAAEEQDAKADDTPSEAATATQPGYDRYLVVPRDYRGFTAARRKELGVLGDFFSTAMQGNEQVRGSGGFLAWITADEAKKLEQAAEVAKVIRLTADDIPRPSLSSRKGEQKILVQVLPGDWKTKPRPSTYLTTDLLLQQWKKEFKQQQGLSLSKGPTDSFVVLEIGNGEPPEAVLTALRKHPQVLGLQWMPEAATRPAAEGGVTTKALGEEGGPTTEALGEEGAPPPTTRRLGEEGQLPQPTTLALGEEGAQPVPPPQVTTFALGEEGK
jgi:hypothetical protein